MSNALFRMADGLAMTIAWLLPRRVVAWCAYRVAAHATTGEWGHVETPALTFVDAMARWPGQ